MYFQQVSTKANAGTQMFNSNLGVPGWVAQLVKLLTSARVMILQSVSLSTTSGSVLTAQNLKQCGSAIRFLLKI